MVKEIPYKEGTWFAVPLQRGGYASGVVARMPRQGKVLLGYFFGPRAPVLPDADSTRHKRAEQSVLVRRFGDLGLMNGDWPIIAHSEPWDRSAWPMPLFVRTDSISGKKRIVEYDEDTNEEIKESLADPSCILWLPEDGMSGYVAVEKRLDKILQDPSD